MSPHKQKLKDQYRQSETVVLLLAIYFAERHTLQFRRRVFWKSSFAAVSLAVERDLKAVDVQQMDRRPSSDQDVFGIHVAYDQSMFVDGRDGSRDVGSDINQKGPRSFGEFLQPAPRAVQRVNLFGFADLFHHEAGDFSV